MFNNHQSHFIIHLGLCGKIDLDIVVEKVMIYSTSIVWLSNLQHDQKTCKYTVCVGGLRRFSNEWQSVIKI
jgi:hypothetical protein